MVTNNSNMSGFKTFLKSSEFFHNGGLNCGVSNMAKNEKHHFGWAGISHFMLTLGEITLKILCVNPNPHLIMQKAKILSIGVWVQNVSKHRTSRENSRFGPLFLGLPSAMPKLQPFKFYKFWKAFGSIFIFKKKIYVRYKRFNENFP